MRIARRLRYLLVDMFKINLLAATGVKREFFQGLRNYSDLGGLFFSDFNQNDQNLDFTL